MNNAGELNKSYERVYGTHRTGYVRRSPAWLVMICRVILWMSREEIQGALRAMVAIGAVAVLAIVAGAMGCSAVPLANGIVICTALGVMALFVTRDF